MDSTVPRDWTHLSFTFKLRTPDSCAILFLCLVFYTPYKKDTGPWNNLIDPQTLGNCVVCLVGFSFAIAAVVAGPEGHCILVESVQPVHTVSAIQFSCIYVIIISYHRQ